MKCFCKNKNFITIYNGKIRAGAYPLKTKKKNQVIECRLCGIVRLKNFPKLSYKSKEYRNLYNKGLKLENSKKFNNIEQTPGYLNLKIHNFKNKIVLDYGCGFGIFLDNVLKISKKTLAIEPQINLQKYLISKGHEVINEKLENNYYNKVDTITSIGVIEHVSNPLKYLEKAFKLLKRGGKIFVCTDNFNDVLMSMKIKEFEEFYYRTAHYWYFTSKSLTSILKQSGFKKISTKFIHKRGFKNFEHWLINKKPLNDNKLVKNKINNDWIKLLNTSGRSELILISAEK
jgi:2-polyprenyl-3-methyl-5-hydroxy-6-metoxy-1,4-benzoquinol methylase